MELTEGKLKQATKKYNEIMNLLCYEHKTIGETLSEDTEDWNLRDMVAECDYVLSTYYENGHVNYDLKREDPKVWRSEVGRLKRFITHWLPYAEDMICAHGHCSQYDN